MIALIKKTNKEDHMFIHDNPYLNQKQYIIHYYYILTNTRENLIRKPNIN